MTDKYKVSKAVMYELEKLKDNRQYDVTIWSLLENMSLTELYPNLYNWTYGNLDPSRSSIKIEQAVIDFVYNNADNFEVKTPTWVIVSEKADDFGDWCFLRKDTLFFEIWVADDAQNKDIALDYATHITDPKLKDALLYANPAFEEIEVEE